MIKKLLMIVVVLASLSFVVTNTVHAGAFNLFQDVCSNNTNNSSSSSACASTSTTDPISGSTGVIAKATQIIAITAGVAAVIMIIIAGFQFVSSGGDSQRVATARQTILYAVIGIIIAAIAQSIVMFVLSR